MNKTFMRFCSMVLAMVLLFNMLPMSAFASELQEMREAADDVTAEPVTDSTGLEDMYIVEEIIEGRTEYSKEYRMSNGLHMTAMYAEPIHYREDGAWEEIDNTLKASANSYINTAGVWSVSFPKQMDTDAPVSITKDGYTLSFYMEGELHTNTDNVQIAAITANTDVTAVKEIQAASAQIQQVEITRDNEEFQYSEAVADKNHAQLEYKEVFENTDVRYDLQANQVKESIIIESFDPSLSGYQYTLNVGNLIPVLTDSGEIHMYDENRQNIVMVMPAPFMIDNAGESSEEVEVILSGDGSLYTLSYILPQSWLASTDREWPVILDPVVDAGTKTTNICDASVYEKNATNTYTSPVLEVGHNSTNGKMRIYIKYKNLPELTSADVIVAASINLPSAAAYSTDRVIEAHKVLGSWESSSITWANQPSFNTLVEDYATVNAQNYYAWDITDIVRGWYEGENTGVMFKARDHIENTTSSTSYKTQFYASDYSTYTCPQLFICFRNNNGLESYWDYTASSAGRAGTGYVNNYTGNLVWIRNDIGFGGNRMPVSISHVYNANDSKNNTFGMGYGWRTNFNQLVYQWSVDSEYYVWEDSDGTKHYFKKVSSGKYEDEDGLELTLTTTGSGTSKYKLVDKDGNASYFDTNGRLSKQENNQATKSSILITYTTSSGKLIKDITDGAGRKYNFTYSNSLLSKISYVGTGSTVISSVSFAYSSSKLTSVTDYDSKKSTYGYTDNLLNAATDVDGYKLSYSYTTTTSGKPNRISKVSESDDGTAGGSLTIKYAHNQTTFTDVSGNVQIVQFNNWGNTVSIQDGEGRAQYAQYANNDSTSSSTAKGNQLTLESKLQNTVGNVIDNSSFENSSTWTTTSTAVTQAVSTDAAYYGSKSLKLTRSTSGSGAGVNGPTFTVKAGETYTFSAYLKTGTPTAHIALTGGSTTVTSETVTANQGWTRVEVPFTATADTTVTPKLLMSGSGSVYMDCVQIEKAPTASRYNLVENGDFRHGLNGWSLSEYCNHDATTEKVVTLSPSPAPQLSTNVFQMAGDPTVMLRAYNKVQVSGNAGDTFVVGGWAKGKSVAMTTENDCTRSFAMQVRFINTDGTSTYYKFNFNPNVDDAWQYRSGVAIAKKAYSAVQIQLIYDYNMNKVYFDGIQLYKEQFGTSYTYDDNGNIISVVDLQKQTTEYEYSNNNLTKQTLPSGAALTYTYDSYHNVKTAKSAEGLSYSFEYDKYGNNTSVSIVNGSSKITSTATYSSDGNRLVSTTDALGNTTTYNYNANTNVLEWVQYPEDTTATRTEYTYDTMYRMAEAAVSTDSGLDLSAKYTYTNDLLTKIQTAKTTYNFAYGNFALRSSIKVGSTTLASYTYEAQTNRLTKLDYGNDYNVQYEYDGQGRVTKQAYFKDGVTTPYDTVIYQYDNNGALATVTDSATGRTTTYYYDFIDRMMKYVEKGAGYTHSVGYEYDNINNLTAIVDTINGTKYTTSYAYDDDNRVTTVSNGNASENYTYDAYGRVTKKVTKHGTGTVTTETFTYKTNSSGAPTGQVATVKITGSYNVTYTYAYDKNGNITSISDGTNTTTYVYDSANQLTRENNQAAGKTTVWTYDNAGNIKTRKEYAYTTGTVGTATDTVTYTYGNSNWGDLLTAYDGVAITSDAIGNPTSMGSRTYTWKNGRQLATLSDGGAAWTFTYNSDGLRTKRTNGTTTYSYVYNGSSLSQMTVGSDKLYFAYDASGTPMSVAYNDTNYYYVTNLQGDVVAILNSSGTVVVQYTYDAWGNLLTTTGSMASTLGAKNPLRYRGYVYDTETGLYYLQSRYYNPEMGRFINEDIFIVTGQGLLGNNMFIYCGNNPCITSDPAGYAWTFSGQPNFHAMTYGGGGRVCAIPDIERKQAEQELARKKAKQRGTLTVGGSVSGFSGKGGSFSIGVTVDTHWNVGVIVSETIGAGSPSAGGAVFISVTNAHNIFNLNGYAPQMGGSALCIVGGEYTFFPDSETLEIYHGGTISFGLEPSPGFEMHGGACHSKVYGGNLFDILIDASRWLCNG